MSDRLFRADRIPVRVLRRVSALLLILFCAATVSCAGADPYAAQYVDTDCPLTGEHGDYARARAVWDMVVHEGKLYVGSGDFNDNAGPVNVWAYDLSARRWENTGTLEEEEISRFCLLDGVLAIPGLDPMKGPGVNYFLLENGAWVKKPIGLPSPMLLDVAYFDHAVFAARAANEGNSPICVSRDGGQSFSPVPMIKNGGQIDLNTPILRVYDLIGIGSGLYALLASGENLKSSSYDLYKYENGAFVFFKAWKNKVVQNGISRRYIASSVRFGNSTYITTGNIYLVNDPSAPRHVFTPNNETVYDLYADNGALYALCGIRNGAEGYKIVVYRNTDPGSITFEKFFEFEYPAPPMSLACRGDEFFIGIGSYEKKFEQTGTVLCIRKETTP